MTLRVKNLLIISITFLILITIIYKTSEIILLDNFKELEEKNVKHILNQATDIINLKYKNLNEITCDWGAWNDTCKFIEDENEKYKENFSDVTFSNMDLNFMIFINSSKKIVYKKYFDLEKQVWIPFPVKLENEINKNINNLYPSTEKSYKQGLIVVNREPILIASGPILTGDYKGPVKGMIIVGRNLQNKSDNLFKDSNTPVILKNLRSRGIDARIRKEIYKNEFFIEPINEKQINGYYLLRDINNQPALILYIKLDRVIYLEGLAGINYLFFSLSIVGLIFSLTIIIIIEKTILSRMSKINNQIWNIIKEGNPSRRIKIYGKDEISELAITTNKMLERLEQSRKKLSKRIMDSIPAQIAVFDIDGNLTATNYRWQRFSSENNEIISESKNMSNYLTFLEKEDEDISGDNTFILNGIKSVSAGEEEHFSAEYTKTFKTEKKHFLLNVTPLTSKNGGTIISRLDITEIKKAKEELIRLAGVIEQVEEMIIIYDTEGNITYINPAFEITTGYKKEEVMGKNITLFSPKEDNQKEIAEEIFKTLKEGHSWQGQLKGVKKTGEIIDIAINVSPVKDKTDKIINYVEISRDISKEIIMENKLKQVQKLEAIGTLAGGIAHDFNNILGAIIGYAEVSLLKSEEESNIYKNLNQILRAGQRAQELVKQLLTFSDHDSQEKIAVHIKPVIKEVINLEQPNLVNIKVSYDIQAKEDAVLAKPSHIHQILLNIITNAIYAMKEKGGLLNIKLSEIFIEDNNELERGHYIKLTVGDTGQGMRKEILDKIFEPFFTTKGPGEGTGLGLSIVHGIVKNLNGKIEFQSEIGKGTTFHIFLPQYTGQAQGKIEDDIYIISGKAKILFVDDEEDLVYIGKNILNFFGYEVIGVTDYKKAIEEFAKEPDEFDLIITDYTMPYITGVELAKELIKIKQDIPIILCTGFNDTLTMEKTDKLNIKQVLFKPISAKTLTETIQHVLN